MSVRVVACLSPNPQETDAMAAYFEVALSLISKAGGKVIQDYNIDQAIIGPKPADKVLIVEYPDLATLNAVFQSDAYQAVIPHREKAFTQYSVSVIGS